MMNERPDLNFSKSKKVPLPVRFMRKPFSYQCLVAESLLWLGITRFVIRYLPFRCLRRLIRDRSEIPGHVAHDRSVSELLARDITHTVMRVSRRVPWKCKCLVQASAVKIMLNKRGISNVMCLGVSKSGIRGKLWTNLDPPETEDSSSKMNRPKYGKKELRPHAWLIAGGEVILGGDNLDNYVTVSRF